MLDRMLKSLARSGRDRDAAQLSSLHSKLVSCSKDILRNRTSILALLHSLSEKDLSSTSQPSPFTYSLPHNSSQEPSKISVSSSGLGSSSLFRAPLSSHPSLSNSSLSHSTSHPSFSTSSHPPLPPKPKSRPTSLYAVETDSVATPGGRSSDSTAPSEQDLVRELVFVFQGIGGSLIRSEDGNYSLDKNIFLPEVSGDEAV